MTTLADWLTSHNYPLENLNAWGKNGHTPLMQATREGDIGIVQELLNQGVDLNLRNHDGNNAIWFACFANHLDLVNLLASAGIDLDNQNDNGATVLMYCASAGKTPLVARLLELGANPHLKNLDDFRALDFASTLEILRILQNVTRTESPR
jgi:ankyrin repeat protein